ncbi:MAG TPA: hypothetical protein VFF63_02975 [Candidatus Babeliales bacterium]|nr:hypothetical protein [Candidatus Babeliales bacterium]
MRQLLLATLIAAVVTPSAIVANPTMYDDKSVTVTGKVSNYQTSSTPMGPVAGYQLCDSKCIVVIDKTNQSRSNGATVTVTGTFHVTFKGPRKTFSNAVVISH